jgi:hypothetical protein
MLEYVSACKNVGLLERLSRTFGNEKGGVSVLLKQRVFRDSGKIFAEYLVKYHLRGDGPQRVEWGYRLDRLATGEIVKRRPATHADRVRLHKFTNKVTIITRGSSLMNVLHASLADAICDQDECCPRGFSRKEWKGNLLRAKDLIRRRKLASNDGLAEITLAIIPRRRAKNWRKQLCGWCHTPLLIGYFLDGHQITRAKEFCGDACKMNEQRSLARWQRLSTFRDKRDR